MGLLLFLTWEAHVADARAACALAPPLGKHHPLLCAAFLESDGVPRTRWVSRLLPGRISQSVIAVDRPIHMAI